MACVVGRQYLRLKEVGKSAQQCSSQELERIDLKRKVFQPKLSDLDFSIELILNNGVGRFASEIFIGGIAERAPRAKTSCIRVSRPECSASVIFRAFSIDRNTDSVREKSASASRSAERALKRWFTRARKERSNICQLVPVGGMVSKTDLE